MNIEERRNELNMTQAELARACHISQQFLCDIEKGRCKPSINTALQIAQALGVDDIGFFSDLVTAKTEQ